MENLPQSEMVCRVNKLALAKKTAVWVHLLAVWLQSSEDFIEYLAVFTEETDPKGYGLSLCCYWLLKWWIPAKLLAKNNFCNKHPWSKFFQSLSHAFSLVIFFSSSLTLNVFFSGTTWPFLMEFLLFFVRGVTRGELLYFVVIPLYFSCSGVLPRISLICWSTLVHICRRATTFLVMFVLFWLSFLHFWVQEVRVEMVCFASLFLSSGFLEVIAVSMKWSTLYLKKYFLWHMIIFAVFAWAFHFFFSFWFAMRFFYLCCVIA